MAAEQYDDTAASAAHSKHVCPENSTIAQKDMCYTNCS